MNIQRLQKQLHKKFPLSDIAATTDARNIVTLKGECPDWDTVVGVGHTAAKFKGVRNIVNQLQAKSGGAPTKDYSTLRKQGEALGIVHSTDVVIVGAGIAGCGVARELAKYNLDITVVEMTEDVATGATKANNGNIHPGHAPKPGTLKAKLNVEGNRMYTQWAEELGFELQRCGAMGFATNWLLVLALRVAYRQAVANNVDGVELVNGKRAREIEPGLNRQGIGDQVKAALWLPSMGVVEPYKVAVALAENAAYNGVKFWMNTTVADVLVEDDAVTGIVTDKGIIKAKYVINCAGLYADDLSAMAGDQSYTIHPRKGVIAILDKTDAPKYDSICEHITFDEVLRMLKQTQTKGGGMCRTPEKNVLMGPSATEIPDREDLSTSPEELSYAMGRGAVEASYASVIRFFAGNRPADYMEDFVIEMSDVTDGFINVGAIQSPGLAAAPAIARMVEDILTQHAKDKAAPIEQKADWQPNRKREVEFRHMSREAQYRLIQQNPAYGRIICRCESITEGEIVDAIQSPVPPTSVDAIKRRCRTGMGRCQGGFCQPRVIEILAREGKKSWLDITLKGEGTNILVKNNRLERSLP